MYVIAHISIDERTMEHAKRKKDCCIFSFKTINENKSKKAKMAHGKRTCLKCRPIEIGKSRLRFNKSAKRTKPEITIVIQNTLVGPIPLFKAIYDIAPIIINRGLYIQIDNNAT